MVLMIKRRLRSLACSASSTFLRSSITPFRAVPLHDCPCLVAQGIGAEQEPPILTVVAAYARFGIDRRASGEAPLPVFDEARHVVRVNPDTPAPTDRLFHREAGVVKPAIAEEVAIPVGTGGPGRRWDRVDDLDEVALAGLKSLVRALAILDVHVRAVPLDDIAGLVAQWIRPEQEPPILTIVAAYARFGIHRRASGEAPLPV